MSREAIGRYHIEPDAGQQSDPGPRGLDSTSRERFEDRDLTRDIEIVCPSAKTGVSHRTRGSREGSGAVDDGVVWFEEPVESVGLIERGHRHRESEFPTESLEGLSVSPRERG
jgi:hypothetical protein